MRSSLPLMIELFWYLGHWHRHGTLKKGNNTLQTAYPSSMAVSSANGGMCVFIFSKTWVTDLIRVPVGTASSSPFLETYSTINTYQQFYKSGIIRKKNPTLELKITLPELLVHSFWSPSLFHTYKSQKFKSASHYYCAYHKVTSSNPYSESVLLPCATSVTWVASFGKRQKKVKKKKVKELTFYSGQRSLW